MTTTKTTGECAYCGKVLTCAGMARHLATCARRAAAIQAADADGRQDPFFHLQVQDAWAGDFWLHLEMAGSATLEKLDHYLRAIWLECCGHLSEFSAGGWRGTTVGKQRKAADVFGSMTELDHVYDFGSSTGTRITVVGSRLGGGTVRHPIALMARNAMPDAACDECGKPATFIVPHLLEEEADEYLFCAEHVDAHADAAQYGDALPLVNSPRSGVCGYKGPATPPY